MNMVFWQKVMEKPFTIINLPDISPVVHLASTEHKRDFVALVHENVKALPLPPTASFNDGKIFNIQIQLPLHKVEQNSINAHQHRNEGNKQQGSSHENEQQGNGWENHSDLGNDADDAEDGSDNEDYFLVNFNSALQVALHELWCCQ